MFYWTTFHFVLEVVYKTHSIVYVSYASPRRGILKGDTPARPCPCPDFGVCIFVRNCRRQRPEKPIVLIILGKNQDLFIAWYDIGIVTKIIST